MCMSAGLRTLQDVFEKGKKQLEFDRANTAETCFFPFPLIKGKLYSIVGASNKGKTWFSLATAISLAREGHKVGYVSTEETEADIAENLEVINDKAVFERVKFGFTTELTEKGFRDALELLVEEGVEVIVLDYLRPDILSEHSGDLNTTMGKLYRVLRQFLNDNSACVIQTIQANATLYKKDFDEMLKANPDQVNVMIDGGYTTYKRSHGVAFIRNKYVNGEVKYWLYVSKGKGHKIRDTILYKNIPYGIDITTFSIRYGKPYEDNAGNAGNNYAAKVIKKGIG